MSRIYEFNSVQPEQFSIEGPDKRTGKRMLAIALLTAVVITIAAAFGFTMNKYKDHPYKALIEKVRS